MLWQPTWPSACSVKGHTVQKPRAPPMYWSSWLRRLRQLLFRVCCISFTFLSVIFAVLKVQLVRSSAAPAAGPLVEIIRLVDV